MTECPDDLLAEAAELGLTADELAREWADLHSTPPGYLPGIGPVSGLVMRMLAGSPLYPFRRSAGDSKCYRISAGMVHVHPDCRCRR
jgi:hypothetical protein